MPERRWLIDQIDALPPAQQAEAALFVEFVAARERASLTRAAAAASAPAFAAVWDNDDAAAYDAL